MRSTCLSLALPVTLLLIGTAAVAGEVVEFTDGRYLEIRNHKVQEHAIILEVDPGAWVVIHADKVRSIGRDGVTVYPEPEAAAKPAVPGGLEMWLLAPGEGLSSEEFPLSRVWEQVCGV